MIQGKILSYGDDLSEALQIRRKVFVEELNMSEDEVFDEIDNESMHVIVYEGFSSNKAVATGRIFYNGDICKIEYVAVLKQYRRYEYGDFTVRMLLNRAFTAGIYKVNILVPTDNVEFFQKIGFILEDNVDNNDTSKYYKMVIKDDNIIKKCKK